MPLFREHGWQKLYETNGLQVTLTNHIWVDGSGDRAEDRKFKMRTTNSWNKYIVEYIQLPRVCYYSLKNGNKQKTRNKENRVERALSPFKKLINGARGLGFCFLLRSATVSLRYLIKCCFSVVEKCDIPNIAKEIQNNRYVTRHNIYSA